MENKIVPQWYNKEWKLILVCVSIPLLGIWGIWKAEKITKLWKILFTAVATLITLRLLLIIKNDFSSYLIYIGIVAVVFLYITIAEYSIPVMYGLLLVTALGLTLPFHYITSAETPIVLKENLTFKNTFVTKDDVDQIIERYNHAPLLEKAAIENEPLVKKLKELKILVPKSSSDND